MSNFSVGDFVRIDFGSFQDRDTIRGVFVHPSMRHLHGSTAQVHSVRGEAEDVVYKLSGADGELIWWSFVPEWLQPCDATQADAAEAMVECFDGTRWPESSCVMLTEPSAHAGSYARRVIASQFRINQSMIVLLDSERDDLVIEIDGEWCLLSDVSEDDYVCCDGGSREGDYIWRDNAVYVEDAGYYHEDDSGEYIYWHEGPDEYRTYPPDEEENTRGYHAQQNDGYISRTHAGTLYTIGFEVEKEDQRILDSYTADDTSSFDWSREHDGSLDEQTGFELVSPIYDVFTNELDEDISNQPTLKAHLDADSSPRCGGHINFGKVGTRGSELLKECAAFLPLFIAMYRKRAVSRWAKMYVDPKDYNGDDRYVAFNVKREYIEFRIVARVHDTDTLLWRRDLFRIMASNPNIGAAKVQQMMLDRRSELHKHLRKMYTEEKLLRLVCWYSQIADAMFDTLQFSKTGHGVMMDFFISSLRRNSKRVGLGLEDVEGWVSDVHDILSRANGGRRYTDNVKKVDKHALRFLPSKG